MDKLSFTQEINKLRKTGTWYQFTGIIDGKNIRIKGYKTWLQIFTVDNVDYSNCMDETVKKFNAALLRPF